MLLWEGEKNYTRRVICVKYRVRDGRMSWLHSALLGNTELFLDQTFNVYTNVGVSHLHLPHNETSLSER